MAVRATLLKIWTSFLDLFFPIFCCGCRREGMWLCDDCEKNIIIERESSCPECGQGLSEPAVCNQCVDSILSGLWVVTHYGGTVKKMLRQLKYGYSYELAEILGRLAWQKIKSDPFWSDEYILTPVPLHRRRFLQRGFNQSQLIARALSERSGNGVFDDLLTRKVNNKPQAGLKMSHRMKNVEGIFDFTAIFINIPKTKTIVLVDDVYTTGATMKECAKVLKKAGFLRVYGLAIARG